MREHRGHTLRRGRRSISNQIYLLTTVTAQRQPLFADFNASRTLIRAMRFQAERDNICSLAFVVMPDHLHWLVELRGAASLSAVMASVKRFSARHCPVDREPVWQPGFHDHALRADDDVRAAARYVVANPLRAGLVKSLWDYPHWDAIWLPP